MSAILDRAMADTAAATEWMRYQTRAAVSLGASSGGASSAGVESYGGLMGPGNRGSQTPNLETHAEQYRHNIGWVFAALRAIRQRIASRPFRVARLCPDKTKKPGKKGLHLGKEFVPQFLKGFHEDIDILTKHPLIDAINCPNEVHSTRWMLLDVMVGSLELTAKAYLWWNYNEEAEKLDIYHLPSSWVERKGSEKRVFDHWEVSPAGYGEKFRIERDAISYIFYPNPADPLAVCSPLAAGARAVVADEHIAEAQRRTFLNGIFPGYALIVGRHPDVTGKQGERPYLTKEQRRDLISIVKQVYRGVVSYDEPMILDAFIQDIKKISATPRELDFQKSGAYTKERIMQIFGVNPIILGQIEGANRASALAAEDHFNEYCINPKIELISQSLTAWAAPLFSEDGDEIVCFLEPSKTSDPDQQMKEEDSLWSKKGISVNEVRSKHGYPPLATDVGDITYGTMADMPIHLAREGEKVKEPSTHPMVVEANKPPPTPPAPPVVALPAPPADEGKDPKAPKPAKPPKVGEGRGAGKPGKDFRRGQWPYRATRS